MRQPRDGELVWTSEDQAAYAKWRRGVLIFYGCLALAALVVSGLYDLAGNEAKDAASMADSVMAHSSAGAARPPKP